MKAITLGALAQYVIKIPFHYFLLIRYRNVYLLKQTQSIINYTVILSEIPTCFSFDFWLSVIYAMLSKTNQPASLISTKHCFRYLIHSLCHPKSH